MPLRVATVIAACLALALPAEARRDKFDQLMQVVTPTADAPASAHPHVNVVVLFGSTIDGVGADEATFQARLNGEDVTALFVPTAANEFGGVAGRRATLEAAAIRLGGRNRLKLTVRSQPFPKGRRTRTGRDKDKIKFVAEEAENQPPVAVATADTDIIFPGLPVQFDGTGSLDPDLDPLEYAWTFGDGGTSSEVRPEYSYGVVEGAVTAMLSVSDGGGTSTASIPLRGEPPLDEGRTKGVLQVTSSGPLEFAAV